jgi:hypothetical protein
MLHAIAVLLLRTVLLLLLLLLLLRVQLVGLMGFDYAHTALPAETASCCKL